jgi:hypothetical protein
VVTRVPEVETRVLCGTTKNLEMFPLPKRRLLLNPPPWNRALGIPRLFNTIGRRVGCGALKRLGIRSWRPQMVHAHFGTRGWESIELTRRLGVPLVTSFSVMMPGCYQGLNPSGKTAIGNCSLGSTCFWLKAQPCQAAC